MAFFVLDVGTRMPGRLAADLRSSLSSAGAFLRGCARFAAGLACLLGGAEILLGLPLADLRNEFFVLETGAVATGLAVEMLVGEPLRNALRAR